MSPSPDTQGAVIMQSFAALSLVYHLAAPYCKTPKQLSWILTTMSSFVMTAVSLAFVADLVAGGGSLQGVNERAEFALPACRFFQAYLLSDLMHGVVYYRSQVTLSTGWFHHAIYLVIVEIAIRRSWTHVFCLACFMELPTFIIGISSLYPRLRSNVLFAVSFFTTRIAYHAFLCGSFYMPDHRHRVAGGSYIPAIIFTLVFPMHVTWFVGCVKGFLRRASATKDVKPVTAQVPPLVPTPAASLVWNIPAIRRHYRARLNQRRQALKQTWVYNMLPGRERVFDYVGLGRRFGNACP